MSRRSELLNSKHTPANSANSANLDKKKSGDSEQVKVHLTADFEKRYLAMCKRWRYDPEDVLEGLEAARKDPAKAWLGLLADESRTNEERSGWLGDA